MKPAKKTYLGRHRTLFDAAAIGGHARFAAEGFRQKDLRFLIELFSNWLEATLEGPSLAVENTQIARYLTSLVTEGLAKQTGGHKQPRYRLTRVGLMEHLTHLVQRPHWWPIEEFFFVYYFLECYRDRIESLIAKERTLFPGPMKLEIHQLLHLSSFVERQEQLLDREIAKLDFRIADCRKTSELAKQLKTKGVAPDALLRVIQEKVPYQLNNQKPMADLFRETPGENWMWEMEVGSEKRASRIFLPLKELLVHIRGQVTLLRVGH
ncbi:MAG TPA: hypothetical protein VFI05_07960 [Nitrospiraceae bacterium]|nr:hypothetical protein [Nitrospiraceae bacterium]